MIKRIKLALITGASKGIGLALAKELLKKEFQVINLSRSIPTYFHDQFSTIKIDLSSLSSAIIVFEELLSSIDFSTIQECILINNAGVLEPMYPIGTKIEESIVEKHFAINTIIPIEFSSRFIAVLKNQPIKKMILNVGSGAANQPINGWAIYGASKAALHYFNHTLAKEQSLVSLPVKVVLFDPGRTDTGMQEQIRNTKEIDFPLVESFKLAFEEGKLNNPNYLAEKVVQKLCDSSLKQGDIISHKDL